MTGPRAYAAFVRDNAAFLAAGVLICFTSNFGQTWFISLFAAGILRDFGLTDGQWGLVYMVATGASAGAMIFAGGLTDRVRVRVLAMIASVGLALACLALATVEGVAALLLTIWALRFFGQGLMTHMSAVAMSRWFVATRGKALSISAMGFSLGQATLPIIFVALLATTNWRNLWFVAGLLVLLAMPVILRLLRAERTPQSLAAEAPSVGMDGRHWTRGQMVRHWLFWAVMPLMLGPYAFVTALFFHQVHFVADKGWDLVDYVALMPLFTAVTVAMTFASGAALDRMGTGRLMSLYLLPFVGAFLIFWSSETLFGAALGLAVMGLGTGAQATVPNAFWAEYYGTRHLGSIKAMAMSIMVLGTAIGPGLTGTLIDLGWELDDQSLGIAVYFAAAALLATLAIQRAKRGLAPQIDVIRP
ncbi:CynX/NimT family MFS transporter [Jannaschia pohangensis]|uniref:Predicted arabinose efflux permease, MFS family n=1 Tax=Jannaschia pohangensis TaxID=390807 RepID=A0A1I3TEJ8_9RHOB|nr:MFS transporter [Jannaschia pohangensis]SFJ69604.1 Predicted arabinose efflux permease, MFS family [Jannaschia pohangensis]